MHISFGFLGNVSNIEAQPNIFNEVYKSLYYTLIWRIKYDKWENVLKVYA